MNEKPRTELIADRLEALSLAVVEGRRDEFTMRIPAEPDRDADLVLHEASRTLRFLERDLTAAQARIAELEAQLRATKDWNGKDRRCEHQMRWIKDWYGDPSIPYGTQDCSRLECEQCGWVDPNGEKPERDWDYERDKRIDDRNAKP